MMCGDHYVWGMDVFVKNSGHDHFVGKLNGQFEETLRSLVEKTPTILGIVLHP